MKSRIVATNAVSLSSWATVKASMRAGATGVALVVRLMTSSFTLVFRVILMAFQMVRFSFCVACGWSRASEGSFEVCKAPEDRACALQGEAVNQLCCPGAQSLGGRREAPHDCEDCVSCPLIRDGSLSPAKDGELEWLSEEGGSEGAL